MFLEKGFKEELINHKIATRIEIPTIWLSLSPSLTAHISWGLVPVCIRVQWYKVTVCAEQKLILCMDTARVRCIRFCVHKKLLYVERKKGRNCENLIFPYHRPAQQLLKWDRHFYSVSKMRSLSKQISTSAVQFIFLKLLHSFPIHMMLHLHFIR